MNKIDIDGREITDDVDIANEFNNFFVTSIKNFNEAIPKINLNQAVNNQLESQFCFKPISIGDIKNCMYELKQTNSI